MSVDLLFFNEPNATDNLEQIFDVISNSPIECINHAVSKNQETINELLLKLLVSYKYKSMDKSNSASNGEFNPHNTLEALTSTKFSENSDNLHAIANRYFDVISNDSCKRIVSFLSESDIYLSPNFSLHCISKHFDKLIQETESHRAKYFDEDYYYTMSDLYKSFKKHSLNNKSATDEFKCDMRLPNGSIAPVVLKNFSYPLNSQKMINYASSSSESLEDNNKHLTFSRGAKSQISFGSNYLLFYQNVRLFDVFNKDSNSNNMMMKSDHEDSQSDINLREKMGVVINRKDFEIGKETRTVFTKYNQLRKRRILHNKSMYAYEHSDTDTDTDKSILCLIVFMAMIQLNL